LFLNLRKIKLARKNAKVKGSQAHRNSKGALKNRQTVKKKERVTKEKEDFLVRINPKST
jgi:hypothetical protein